MKDGTEKLLLLLSVCGKNNDKELAIIVKGMMENSKYYQIVQQLNHYFFLTATASALRDELIYFNTEVVTFTEAKQKYQAMQQLVQRFEQLLVMKFVPRTKFDIIHKNTYPRLLKEVVEHTSNVLYDVMLYGDVWSLRNLPRPAMTEINSIVEFTNQIQDKCPCCYINIMKNITNIGRGNVFQILDSDTRIELQREALPQNLQIRHYPEDTLRNLFAQDIFFCISYKNYTNVILNTTQVAQEVQFRGNLHIDRSQYPYISVVMSFLIYFGWMMYQGIAGEQALIIASFFAMYYFYRRVL